MKTILDSPLERVVFCAMDTETTGFYPSIGDRICDIGLIKFNLDEEIDSFSSLVNPEKPISRKTASLTGIRNEMLKASPPIEFVLPQVVDKIGDGCLLFHNAQFDLFFINYELKSYGMQILKNPVVDTLILARRNFSFKSNKLQEIAKIYKIEPERAHRALDDAWLTGQIFRIFIEKLKEKKNIRTLGELLLLQGGSVALLA
jgi:DNA polymerase-3 subunit alpha (Gram-positive type)